MDSTPIKSISLRSTPKGKLIANDSDLTPKKVRFTLSEDGRKELCKIDINKTYKAEDVLMMLNDSSLSEEESESDEEWIVTKSKALRISDSPLSKSNPVNLENKSPTPLKNPVVRVTPLKLLRKTEYEVNKVSSVNKKNEPAVSPIVIKRKTDARIASDVSSLPLTPSSKLNISEPDSEHSPVSIRRSLRQRKPVARYDSDTENECSPPKRRMSTRKKSISEKSKSSLNVFNKISSDDNAVECSDSDDNIPLAVRLNLLPQPSSAIKNSVPDSPMVVKNQPHTPRTSARKKLELPSPAVSEVISDQLPNSPNVRRSLRTPRTSVRKKLELDSPNVKQQYSDGGDCSDFLEEHKTPKRKSNIYHNSFADSPSLRRQILTPKHSAKKKLELSSPGIAKKIGSGFLSPTVKERTRRNLSGTPSTKLEVTRANLHTSNIPTSLPCREKEFNNILAFAMRKIEDKAGGCMYISGVPGTGKTATVHAVIKLLQEKAENHELSKFDFVEVNALRLTEPRQLYTRLWQELSGSKCSPEVAMIELEKKFNKKCKCSTVILVDELDYLCNRRQDVIYNILEWSTKSSAALTVITIANTMDLPERTLKGKVTSRMGLTRLVFQPYTFQQLQQIVLNRIGSNSNFHVDAVQLVARKVAAVSGDARRALDICRRATELISSDSEVVKVSHIEKALTQIFAGTRVQAIKKCSVMNQFLLRAMRDEFHRTGVEETTVGQVYPQFCAIVSLEGYEVPPIGLLLNMSSVLSDSGLILAEKCRSDLNRKLSLNVSPDDIHYALSC